MSFEINLLKDRVKQSKRTGFQRIILYVEILMFFLTYILLFSYRLNLDYKLKDTQRNLQGLNEDIIFLSVEGVTLSSLKEINKKYAEITSQLSTINDLTKDRILLSPKLKGISQILPENMWINKVYITEEKFQAKNKKEPGKTKVIYLEGFVMTDREEAFKRVQSFIKDLEQELLFKKGIDSIKLSSISKPQTASSSGGEITEFKIACNILKK